MLASVLVSRSIQALVRKDFESGISLMKESLKIRRALGDPGGTANSLAMLGELASSLGNLSEARAFWLEALEFAKIAGEKRITAIIVGSLGEVSEKMGAFDEALNFYTQSLPIAQKLRDYYLAGINLFALASVKVSQGSGTDVEEAIKIFGAAKTLHRKYGARLSGIGNYEEIERKIPSLRESLGEEFFEAAYAEGEAMDFDQAVAFALSQTEFD
ncbi:MAG TPA: tetratricopeptide repeat protein [Anaerolineales bacterium]|nr:tetratricopeptide repeat protein [Anaerolineales bacterium]